MGFPVVVAVSGLVVVVAGVAAVVVVVLLFVSKAVAVRGRLSGAMRRVLTGVLSHVLAVIHLPRLCSISK